MRERIRSLIIMLITVLVMVSCCACGSKQKTDEKLMIAEDTLNAVFSIPAAEMNEVYMESVETGNTDLLVDTYTDYLGNVGNERFYESCVRLAEPMSLLSNAMLQGWTTETVSVTVTHRDGGMYDYTAVVRVTSENNSEEVEIIGSVSFDETGLIDAISTTGGLHAFLTNASDF